MAALWACQCSLSLAPGLLVVLLLMRVWLMALMWRPTVRRSLVGLQAYAAHLCLHIASIFMCTQNTLQSQPW